MVMACNGFAALPDCQESGWYCHILDNVDSITRLTIVN